MQPHADTHADDALLDQLSAYLDGELDLAGRQHIEALLASDDKVRRELQRLEQAWSLLDDLPRHEVTPDFTRSTVEMIAVNTQQELDTEARGQRLRRVGMGLFVALGLCIVAGAGYTTVDRLWPDPDEAMLRDLPVLERLEAYRHLDDIEFLRLLKQEQALTPAEVHRGK